MATDANRESTVLNLRVSKSKLATFRHLSQKLGVSVNSIVNSFLMWAEVQPEERHDWIKDVQGLRELVREFKLGNPIVLEEITRDRYAQRLALCQRLQNIGYIDGYNALQNPRDPDHMICSYKLTASGMIVASALESAASGTDVCMVPADTDADDQEERITEEVA
ncbi:MAG: hypothetical protein JWM87_1794 [Candidatus Eremiobacteraeota bacterium]|nr:hypothetical protein [Candidatus Eremiobacteraeota bacterium]